MTNKSNLVEETKFMQTYADLVTVVTNEDKELQLKTRSQLAYNLYRDWIAEDRIIDDHEEKGEHVLTVYGRDWFKHHKEYTEELFQDLERGELHGVMKSLLASLTRSYLVLMLDRKESIVNYRINEMSGLPLLTLHGLYHAFDIITEGE